MADWVSESGVPIFRPHVRKDESGKVMYEVTAADIPVIVKNSANLTVELHGNKPPITEGHRNFEPDAKECDQPLVMGYLDNFRQGTLPDGTPVVLCDRHYMQKYEDRAKRHPYASVDYIHGRKAIVGLAKLTRPPALNLGAVFYPGTSEPVYVYSMGAEPVEDQAAKPAPEAGATPELTPEEIQGCEKVYAYLCKKYAWMSSAAQQYEAGAGQPSATNTKPPEEMDDDNDEKPGKDKDKPDMSQANTDLVQKYNATQEQLAALIKEREAEKIERTLDNLEKVDRYQFDREAERKRLLPMTAAERDARVEEIKKYHPRTGADRIEVYQGNATGPAPETTRDMANAAVLYATKHNVSYDEGLAAVKAGKN